jgi:hypothetical protein
MTLVGLQPFEAEACLNNTLKLSRYHKRNTMRFRHKDQVVDDVGK